VQLTGTGLCLGLNRAEVVCAFNSCKVVLGLNRAGVRCAVNRCRIVYGTQKRRSGA
jgi:hypothetical protein